MRIVHLSTFDYRGGAARSAYRLHKGLERIGYDSSMLVREKSSPDPKARAFSPATDIVRRLRRRLRREFIQRDFLRYGASRPAGLEAFSDDRTPHGDFVARAIGACDIVHLHWVAGFLDYQTFFPAVPRSRPVVWTLHDMNAFTGGCHYDLGCGKYADVCGSCPQLGSSEPRDLAHQVWLRKQDSLAKVDPDSFHIVTPSRWLAEEVKRSGLLARFSVHVIPYGIDVAAFAPRDRVAARDVLGIPQDANILLFLADVITNSRKGFDLLMQALPDCAKSVKQLTLMSLGHNPPQRDLGIPWLHYDFVNDERLLSLMYSAADVFVIPSRQDNLPNTVVEALACGVPAVGFDVGGIPDMVRPGITGLLVPPDDVPALCAAIVELFEDPTRRRKMATNCRRIAVEEYPLELQARRYSDLYTGCLWPGLFTNP
jgi:glycosyltransferase involved in cell wall biosynthesis